MSNGSDMDVSAPAPPAEFTPPLKALWWLKKGGLVLGPEWEVAHTICQADEGEPDHDWVHALCHLIEGDHGNAAYWFRRAGRPAHRRDVEELWQEIAAALG